jgi:ribonucleoside-diphosphate reductase alpha chain
MSDTAREETMATAEQAQVSEQTTEEIVNRVVQEDASVAPRRYFTIQGRDPFEEVEWELRHAFIPGKDGPAFEQKDVEFPKFWSQTATNIVSQKYFRGRMSSPERERSVKQMIGRIVATIGSWGREGGYFATDEDADTFEAELKAILVNQYASFNSPVWFNVGFEARPQCSACFILSIDDSMESILDWIRREGIIFRGGSGSGVNLSRLRSSKEQLSKGGYASGPVSFMRGADASAGTIKSGGKTRRAAKMVVLDVDHPDVEEFIWCKAKEERKARVLESAGYDMTLDSPDWASIQYQNANNSVRVTDAFMEAVIENKEWNLTARTDGSVVETTDARGLLRQMAEAAWECADPGVQYDTTINNWHTLPNTSRINASNPCFPGDARVHTTRGLLTFHELFDLAGEGEQIQVYTHRATAEEPGDGVVATTTPVVMQNGVSEIVRLRFSNGQELRCTPSHRIWTLNRGYVEAAKLTSEDQVFLNDSPTPAEDASWALPVGIEALAGSRAGRGGTVTYQALPQRWSEGLGELLGHLVGDGWLTDVQAGWVYGGDDIDDGLAGSHEGMLRELIGGISVQQMQNGTLQLRAGSEAVRMFFYRLGVTSARAHEKRVPSSVFGAPTEVQAAFLRGLFGADGCISRAEDGKANRYAGLASRSEALLKDVQRLLNAFGVRSRIYSISGGNAQKFAHTRVDGTEVEYQSRAGFDLRITGSDLDVFATEIGLSTPRKQAALETLLAESERYRTKPGTRLVSREDDGQEFVYNLTEPLHHSYIVDGVLVANCSEYMSIDDSACNLASLNLLKFRREDGELDIEAFEHAVDVVFLAQEIAVGYSSYPTPEIERNAKAFRQLGLGYANLGALLMARGLPYDSDEGRAYAAAITALMTGRAYRKSAEVAKRMGPFVGYRPNAAAMIGVIAKHRAAVGNIDHSNSVPDKLLNAARKAWDEALEIGEVNGYRNAQASVLAPTGTISFMMDCDTTGVEPDFSLVKSKKLVGGGEITIVNKTVPMALEKLGYAPNEVEEIAAFVDERNTVVGAPYVKAEHYPVFDCAIGDRSIHYMGHVKMMGAVQPFISGAISKTVNLPEEITVDEIGQLLIESWQLGIKAIAIYRDNCKVAQPLSKKGDAGATTLAPVSAAVTPHPQRRRLPDDRVEVGRKFKVGEYEGYIHVGLFDDGTPGDIFVDIAKEGTTLAGLMNSFMISVSLGLQYGVPLEVYVSKFSHMRFEPSGMTNDEDIRVAKSIVDYIFRWMGKKFLSADQQEEAGILTPEVKARLAAAYNDAGEHAAAAVAIEPAPPGQTALFNQWEDAVECAKCGGRMVRTGSCYTCRDCGSNTGCS